MWPHRSQKKSIIFVAIVRCLISTWRYYSPSSTISYCIPLYCSFGSVFGKVCATTDFVSFFLCCFAPILFYFIEMIYFCWSRSLSLHISKFEKKSAEFTWDVNWKVSFFPSVSLFVFNLTGRVFPLQFSCYFLHFFILIYYLINFSRCEINEQL